MRKSRVYDLRLQTKIQDFVAYLGFSITVGCWFSQLLTLTEKKKKKKTRETVTGRSQRAVSAERVSRESASRRPSNMQTTTHIISQKPPPVLREGLLYKQRNHFKGWRSRWFVLDNQFLHYYLEKEDMASRNSIQIGTVL